MLTLEETEKILLQTDYGEKEYQEIYRKNPAACRIPIVNWEEFQSRFDTEIIERPPTDVNQFLREREYFDGEDVQVNCFKNVRYCPPFLHRLEFIKIVYILKGRSIFYLNHKSYELQEGNFCIVSPGVKQALLTEDSDSVAVNLLLRASAFSRTFSTLLTEQGDISQFFWNVAYTNYHNRVLLFRSKPDDRLKQLILRLFYEVRLESHPSNLIQESYVCVFLGEGIRRYGKDMSVLEGLDGEVYQIPYILEDIKKNLAQITLKELAKKWKCSEQWIRYQLKVETGYSFQRLLWDLRLQEAARALTQGKESIELIMEKIGCSDPAAFYRNFKKRYGQTPQEYRSQR